MPGQPESPMQNGNNYVTWRIATVFISVFVVLGGLILTLSWGTNENRHEFSQQSREEMRRRLISVEHGVIEQRVQLSNIADVVIDLRTGQAAILERLPSKPKG